MSPTMQDSKFEVIMSSESDLEEGEILEYDYSTSKQQIEDGEVADDYYTSKSSERLRSKFKMKHEKEYLGDDYIRQEKLSEGSRRDHKRNYKLNKSSSDGELSDLDRRDLKKLSLTIKTNSIDRKSKPRHGLKNSYGTVEDIMTQIDATLCRKSLCNYKRRKSREIQYSSERTHKTRSSSKERSRSKHRKKSSSSESDSDNVFKNKKLPRNKIPVCKRKREKELKKMKEVVYTCSDDSSDDDSAPRKKGSAVKKKRDFDEYRKQLLEKLSKEKSDSKSNCENIPLPAEEEITNSSDIQEIEMMDESNAFVDDKIEDNVIKPPEVTNKSFMDSFYVTRNVPVVNEPQESENEDDDTELIKLRLLALTSNRKKKEAVSDDASSHSLDFEQSSNVDVKSEENLSDKERDSDLDRNEFLLRAEALKTALLKKHKLKKAKENVVENPNSKLTEITEEKLKNNEEINIPVRLEVKESVNVPEVPTEPKENIQNDISSPGEIINPLEIARRKLLKVRNVLMMSDASNNSDVREDSLQARLLALASETSLPKPAENIISEAPKFIPTMQKPENNSKPGISRKRRKRLRWKMRRRNKIRNKLNTEALKENAVESGKIEDDDEILRVQLLNDLSKKKLSKVENVQPLENKASEIVENKPLLDKQIINVKNNKNSNKVAPLGIVPKAEIQRIIVHLGSDSSDDEDLEPEVKPLDLNVPCEEKIAEEVPTSTVGGSANPLLADYERSVELLLQKAREEVERKEKSQKSVTATPEAVYKHLPPSQRLEYMRLKQKIAEKENLKKKTTSTVDGNPSQTKSDPNKNSNLNGIKRIVTASLRSIKTDNQLPPKSSSQAISSSVNIQSTSNSVSTDKSANPIKISSDSNQPLKSNSVNKPVGNVLRSPVKTTASKMGSPAAQPKKILNSPLNGKKPIVSPEQRKIIVQNQANISRLKLLLKKIKIEKTVEERYEKEIQKLKNQLNLLELKRKQQRVKIENLAKESKMIYASFQSNRTDIKKLNDAGKVVMNKSEKTEEKKELQPKDNVKEERMEVEAPNVEGKEVSENCENQTNNQLKLESECEVKVEIKSEPKNEGPLENQVNSSLPSSSSSNAPDLKEYNSPLQAFSARTEDQDGKRIDPNAIMCQYDLLGKCNDKECTFQHYRTS